MYDLTILLTVEDATCIYRVGDIIYISSNIYMLKDFEKRFQAGQTSIHTNIGDIEAKRYNAMVQSSQHPYVTPILTVLENIVSKKNKANFENLEDIVRKLVFDIEQVKNCTIKIQDSGIPLLGGTIKVKNDYLIYSLELIRTAMRSEYCFSLGINPNHNKTQMRFLHIPTTFLGLPVVYSPSLMCYDNRVRTKDTSHLDLSTLNSATNKVFANAGYDVDLSKVVFTNKKLEEFFTLYPRTLPPFQSSGYITFDITKKPVYVFYSFRFERGFVFCPHFFNICDVSTWENNGKGFSLIYVLEENLITDGIIDAIGYHCLGNFKTYKEAKGAITDIKDRVTKEIVHSELMGLPYLKAIQYVTYKKYDG